MNRLHRTVLSALQVGVMLLAACAIAPAQVVYNPWTRKLDFTQAGVNGTGCYVVAGLAVTDSVLATITHNLGTLNVYVSLIDHTTGAAVQVAWTSATINTVTFTPSASQTLDGSVCAGLGSALAYPGAGLAVSTGTGWAASLSSTAPGFTTSVTTPLLIGGTAAGSNIVYKSTTGTGTLTGIAHQWVGGTNGGTTILTCLNNGNCATGTTTPTTLLTLYGPSNWGQIQAVNSVAAGEASISFFAEGDGLGDRWLFGKNINGQIGKFSIYGNSSTKFLINASGNVGIGTTTPLTKLNVVDTLTTSPRGILSSQYSTGTDGARVGFAKARGTEASPTTIVTGDILGRLMFRGYDGANFLEMASIEAVSTGTIAATRVPTYLAFSTATDATPSVLTERGRVTAAGNWLIGTTTDDAVNKLQVNGGIALPSGNQVSIGGAKFFGDATSLYMYANPTNGRITFNDANGQNFATVQTDGTSYFFNSIPSTGATAVWVGHDGSGTYSGAHISATGTKLTVVAGAGNATGDVVFNVKSAAGADVAYTTARGDIYGYSLSSYSATITYGIVLGAAYALQFNSSTAITAPSDGVLKLSNYAGTDFGRLQFGGTTSSFPALAKSSINGFAIQSAAGALTYNDAATAGSGTVAARRIFDIDTPTLTATNASVTYTTATALHLGIPTASTNVTIGNAYSLIADGAVRVGGFGSGIVTKAFADTGYTLTAADHTVLVDATGGTTTINLPACAAGNSGVVYVATKIDASGNGMTLDGNASETINGATTLTTTTQWTSYTIQCLGSAAAWYIQ